MTVLSPTRVYSRAELLTAMSDRQLRRLVREGAIYRARRDNYVSPAMSEELRRAVSIGGSLCCVSALALTGGWRPPNAGLHIAVPRNAARLSVPRHSAGGLTVHWSMGPVSRPLSDPSEAVARLVLCQSRAVAVAVLDSTLRLGVIGPHDIREAMARAPLTRRFDLSDLDPAAESGIESLVRVALRDAGLAVASQVVVSGVGRVDLLVEGRVIVEVDGREWHRGEQERDYRRDLDAVRMGYRVVRVDYVHAISCRELVVAAVNRAVSARSGIETGVQVLRN